MTRVDWKGDAWLRRFTPALNAGLTAYVAACSNKAVENFGRDGNPGTPGGVPGIESGQLRQQQAHASPEALGTPLKAAFGTNAPQGRWTEFGVHAAAGKALAIPVDAEAAARVGRLDANGFGSGSLRDNPNLVYIPTYGYTNDKDLVGVLANKSKLRVWRKANKKSKVLPAGSVLFVLRKSVAARPWILKAANEAAPEARAAFITAAKLKAKADGSSK